MRNYKSILCLLLSLVLIFSVVFPMGAAAFFFFFVRIALKRYARIGSFYFGGERSRALIGGQGKRFYPKSYKERI